MVIELSGVIRPYSYSRHWPGTSLQMRLMRGILFNDIPPHLPPLQASSSPIPRIRIWPIRSEIKLELARSTSSI